MPPRLRRAADRLIDVCALVAAAALLFEVVVILADVGGRAFGAPLAGARDLSQMALLFVVFGGMALCDRLRSHIAVDVFEAALPASIKRLFDVIGALLGALIFAGLTWTVYESSKISLMLNLSTNVIGLPKAYFQWAVCGFSAVAALAMLLRGLEPAPSGGESEGEGREQ